MKFCKNFWYFFIVHFVEVSCKLVEEKMRNNPANFFVVGCMERGGALHTVTILTYMGMTIMFLLIVTVIL